ncbi:MAG: ATP-binding protein [Myxococcota bacterium]|nr:ATP-binding protein [Myxococcota bacterium]
MNLTPAGSPPPMFQPEGVRQSWFVRARALFSAGGILIALIVKTWGGWELPIAPILALLGIPLASNWLLWRQLKAGRLLSDATVAGVLAMDILALTGTLALSGGASNPFSSAYLLYVPIGALLLPPTWIWGVVSLAVVAYSILFWSPSFSEHAHHQSMRAHLVGMWVAFIIVGPVVAYAVERLRRAVTSAEDELAESRLQQARAEKLSALATLSAGAAHELSTPLGTIAIAAGELERKGVNPEVTEDAQLIRREIDRCSNILSQLAVDVGAGMGEAAQPLRVADLLEDLNASATTFSVEADPKLLEEFIPLPRRLIHQALRGLLKNARQASPSGTPVVLRASRDHADFQLEIEDQGSGMSAEIQERAGEPFFTSKPQGEGMGLGLFFARSVVEQIGGQMEIFSEPERGTRVRVRLPWVASGRSDLPQDPA